MSANINVCKGRSNRRKILELQLILLSFGVNGLGMCTNFHQCKCIRVKTRSIFLELYVRRKR